MLTFGPSLFHKNSNPSKIFQRVFLFPRVLPLLKISAILNHFGGLRVQKSPKKDHFVGAASVRKTLKIFDLTTTNAILMKLALITYLNESVNRKTLRARINF